MAEPILAVTVGAGILGVAAWVSRCAGRNAESVRATWRAVAEDLGGRFEGPSGPWYRRRGTSVEATVDGVPVRLDSYRVSTGSATIVYTRAAAPGPAGHRFRSTRRHALSWIPLAFGGQDVSVGDHAYDARFVVKTDDPGWLRDRFSGDVVERHLALPGASLTLKRGRITAVIQGWCGREDRLRALVSLAAAASRAAGG